MNLNIPRDTVGSTDFSVLPPHKYCEHLTDYLTVHYDARAPPGYVTSDPTDFRLPT